MVRSNPELYIQNLQDYAPYPLFVINPDYSIGYVNPAFVEMTGFTLDELIGRTPPYPWWTGDAEQKTRDLEERVLTGEATIERCNVKKDGELFWVQASGKPVTINGQLQYYLSNWVDITGRKAAEQQLNKLNQELRELTAHLDSIREEERGHISRMLHDEIGQAITALKMDVCWLKKGLTPDQKALAEVTDSMIKLIDSTINKARWISTVLRPICLDELGLTDTVRWLVAEFQEMTGISCTANIGKNIKADMQTSTAVYRVLQEALTNIFRHSQATEVNVSLMQRDNCIELRIKDNGVGISRRNISSQHSFGLIGIRERVQGLGGTYSISGRKNQGTLISATIPVQTTKRTKQDAQDLSSR
jgi:two-component system sensor histidine kinase UhpB